MKKLKQYFNNLMIYISFLIQASFVFVALILYPIDLLVRVIHRTKLGRITKDELIKDYLMICESLRDCMAYAKEEGAYKKDISHE